MLTPARRRKSAQACRRRKKRRGSATPLAAHWSQCYIVFRNDGTPVEPTPVEPMVGGKRKRKGYRMMRKTSLILLSAAAGAALTLFTTQPQIVFDGSKAQAAAAETYRELSLFQEVFERVRADYVDKPDDGKLIESAINGMLAGLHPHSRCMHSKSFRAMQTQLSARFVGLGM